MLVFAYSAFSYKKIIATIFISILLLLIHFLIKKIVQKFGKKSGISRGRIKMVLKYVNWFLLMMFGVLIITLWGVDRRQILVVLSSIFAVIGVAMFAQWSMLSNITAGIILFFAFPYRIGDKIYIIDKDNPIEAEIVDIRSFYTLLKNADGEKISIPNNILLQKGILIRKRA